MKLVLMTLAALSLGACASNPKPPLATRSDALPAVTNEPPIPVAPNPSTAEVSGPHGVTGTMVFTNEGKTLHVLGEFNGLKPNTEHGIHIHENGSCEGKAFANAGSHFNPWKTKHGGENSKMRHAGDLGNLMSDDKGYAKIDERIPTGPDVGVFGGKAVILHAGRDDEKSQPAGNSGEKIACGLIKEKM